jgi:hypothetical protein
MAPVAKCWKCGGWIHPSDDYEADGGFYTCADCLAESPHYA